MSKKRSYFNGDSYAGCRVSVKLVRKGYRRYEPREIKSPEDVYGFMRDLGESDRERFYSLHLDNRNSVVGCEEVSCGSVNTTMVHPREAFKSALLSSTSGIILVRNLCGAPHKLRYVKSLVMCSNPYWHNAGTHLFNPISESILDLDFVVAKRGITSLRLGDIMKWGK